MACTADGAWDLLLYQKEIFQNLGNYGHRIKIKVNNTAQDEAFTDFPVLVILNTSRITYSNISADGTGIKFISSDHTEELSYEVEEWNSGGESVFWVKVPSITALSNTDYFWLYYSTESNSNNTQPEDVWSNNYLAVWHMNDTGGIITDSTSFELDGTVNMMEGPVHEANGKISGAMDFIGDSDKIVINSAQGLDDLGPVTFSFWMLDTGYSDQDIIFNKGELKIHLLPAYTMDFFVDYVGGSDKDLERAYNDSWAQNIWQSFFITWTGAAVSNKITIHSNGVVPTNLTDQSNGGGSRVSDEGFDLIIGNDSLNNHSFPGQLDEIRISNAVRTPEWIKAQYLSMTDAFLSYGAEEIVSN